MNLVTWYVNIIFHSLNHLKKGKTIVFELLFEKTSEEYLVSVYSLNLLLCFFYIKNANSKYITLLQSLDCWLIEMQECILAILLKDQFLNLN